MSARYAHRAVVFTRNGEPASVLSTLTYPALPPPPPHSLNLKFRLSPINPSDINVVEGIYPSKPEPTKSLSAGQQLTESVCVPGNEGLAEVTDVGEGVTDIQKGDWVVMAKPQAGTWSSARTLGSHEVIKLDKGNISEVNAATIAVNPPTAYLMLRDYVNLNSGDWVIQNGANSAVGQAIIQIAAQQGVKTINFVRGRPDIDALKQQLTQLGATHVFTYNELSDKSFYKSVKELTGNNPPRLLLNCVSGPTTAQLTRLLGTDARLVSYGAMSKQPLAIPTGPLIFRGLKVEGFWITGRWSKDSEKEEKQKVLNAIVQMKLKEPEHEIVTLEGSLTDEQAGARVREVARKIGEGKYGKKVLLRIEDPVTNG
ncbi:hypothetical protein IEO21_06098 [Rhodonia placenta]|uniref:enoyl-[acyl-carrier-protein] reductase n=1 Tax=Rhodonia placenta TaxID=104341 RepID=A0A8H7U111_9APHY|nr:hypothetical protein IEO21_06098 [Postia placenta]